MLLSTCLACRLCSWKTYHSVDFQKHIDKHHPSQESAWYPPLPDLSKIEIKKEVDESEISEALITFTIDGLKAEQQIVTVSDETY